jgi:ABC-type Fe3+ transport system substrate-binding protein
MHARLVALAALLVLASWPALAQSWQDEWKTLQQRAKGQTLSVSHQPNDSITMILDEFSKKFGIKVEAMVARPSATLSRVQTEQRNGQHLWDLWWGGTSTMVNVAIPAGLLEKIEQYMILPEVKDPNQWRHIDFTFADVGRHVYVDINETNYAILRNVKVLPEVKIETADDFLNPKLKGRISSRDASTPNYGTFALATLYRQRGAEFLTKLLKDQELKVFENPQQLEASIVRGQHAVAFGLESGIWEQCRRDGGCKDVEQMKQFSVATSWGMSVPKNPPHPDAVKVWVNWIMSKEGQEAKVRHWPKTNDTGALSMRKDVAPAPGHERFLPDFSKPEQYVFVSSDKGSVEIDATTKIFKEFLGK